MTDDQLPTRASRRRAREEAARARRASTDGNPPATPTDSPAIDSSGTPSPVTARRTAESPAESGRGRPGHARAHRSHGVLRGLTLAVAGVLAFGVAGAGTVYANLQGNVHAIKSIDKLTTPDDSSKKIQPPRDPDSGTALNYLILGSDDRSGENGEIADHASGGMRSDTTMVMHVSADRKHIGVVSIPRDTMVQIPSCTMTNGRTTGSTFGMFNAAFAYGADNGGDVESAVACTWKTVESVTGVSLDGAVVVDFEGFLKVVDALGGVPMCIPEDTVAPAAHLNLKAGYQTLNGADALGYARARKGVGQNFDGSDITRTGRQQQLLAAIFNEITKQNMLTNLPRLYHFADAVTSSLTVTESLKRTKSIVGLAYSLRHVHAKDVTFLTIPVTTYPADHNRVIFSDQAADVWQKLIDDTPVTGPDDESDSGDDAADTSTSGKKHKKKKGGSASSTPTVTKTPAREAFTAGDTTAVCS